MELRLGELLVQRNVLTPAQVQRILDLQEETAEPFGVIAERQYGIDPARIEEAWAEQYASLTKKIDPANEPIDIAALQLITRRQAWQFRILPIRFDGSELMVATTVRHLRRALRFATNVIGLPVYFVVTDTESLGRALQEHFPLPGMTLDTVDGGGMQLLVRSG